MRAAAESPDASGVAPAVAPTVAQIGASMLSRDRTAHWLGLSLEEIRLGYARMHMTVRPEMTNGHGICHGGMIFTLADTTFAYACNSHNIEAVAASCAVEFLKPARAGNVLIAEGREEALVGRHGVYDVRVTTQTGELIAVFRGKSAQLKNAVYQGS